MHFRPFSVTKKKKIPISPIFEIFWPIYFLTICLILGFSPPPPWKPRFPTGPPLSFYIKNRKKIGFPMPTPKNGFQILNLHPKKHVFKKKTFFMYFYLSNTVFFLNAYFWGFRLRMWNPFLAVGIGKPFFGIINNIIKIKISSSVTNLTEPKIT